MNTEQDAALDAQLFTKSGNKLRKLDENGFKQESELQNIIENNINDMLGIDYINTEVSVGGLRIDTVAFDRATNSFVIVEYKRDKSISVIDQGTAYLAVLKRNQDSFVLEYNKKFKRFLESKDFDWEQSRVILIARTFNTHQRLAADKPDLRIELYEIRRYSGGTILLNPVHKVKKVKGTRKKHPTKKRQEKTENMEGIHQEIISCMVALNKDIQVRPKKKYTAFKLQRNFAWAVLWKNSIDVTFLAPAHKLKDPKKMIEDVTSIGHFGGGNLRMKITDTSEIPYLMNIIKQILEGMNS